MLCEYEIWNIYKIRYSCFIITNKKIEVFSHMINKTIKAILQIVKNSHYTHQYSIINFP